MAAIVPDLDRLVDLVSLVDPVDRLLDFPQMVGRDVVTDSAELALDSNTLMVVRSRLERVERCSALWAGIMVIIMPVAIAMVDPAGSSVDQSSWIQLLNTLCKILLGVIIRNLRPSFIVNYLRYD